MEVGVEESDPTQKIQPNGPRVSFNRDVHVKRIGNRLNESENYPVQKTNLQPPQNSKPPLRRELPADLSEESILKEAALVLAQAERVKCRAEGGNDIVGGRLNEKSRGRIQRRDTPIPNKFHSLPTRSKKSSKPITRSVSDVSSKKSKKPSIFSIFSRKSEPNLDQLNSEKSPAKEKESSGKRVARSKSDVGSSKEQKTVRKRNLSENEDATSSPLKPTQLSPIIENTQREDYFAKQDLNEIKDTLRLESKSKSKSPTKVESKTLPSKDHFNISDHSANVAKDVSKRTNQLFNIQSKSLEDMHCSQLPAEKPPLTKGRTVDGMVKRLSMERFSPPPQLSSPGFSYIRPTTEQVIYAQVVCDNSNSDIKAKHSVHSNLDSKKDMELQGHPNRYSENSFNHRSTIERSAFPSHHHNNNNYKSEVVLTNGHQFESRSRSHSPSPIKFRPSDSPQHWKQTPRNLSDEDEGLGFEPRKYFEEDVPESHLLKARYNNYNHVVIGRKSPSDEPPIVPVIRSVSPPIDAHLRTADRGRADGMDAKRRDPFIESHNEINDLSYRRAALESKIRNRRLGSIEPEGRSTIDRRHYSPEKNGGEYQPPEKPSSPGYYRNERHERREHHERYLSPSRHNNTTRYHQPNVDEIVNKYSPERSHVDIISPGREVKSSRYVHTKTYDDGHGGVREIYEKETSVDEYGQPRTREVRRRERLDSPKRAIGGEIAYDRYREPEHEPKSFDSQFSEPNRSSPENHQRRGEYRQKHEEHWQDSLKRDKLHQRSFDKGDSGIENDFRKESFNGELTSKWRKRTVDDDIHAVEMFLKKERRHTEESYRKRYDFVYRERSIDDGSHFDPRLDKYPKGGSLRKKNEIDRYSHPNHEEFGTLKREKKKGGLEKVKQLFIGSSKKKDSKEMTNGKIETGKVPKDRYMVREEEMRQRYYQHSPQQYESPIPDIATRRRLSTPKSSPLLKRTSSEKTSKPSPLALRDDSTMTKAEKSGWFKSLDRRTKKKSNQKCDTPTRIQNATTTTTEDEFSTLRVKKSHRSPVVSPSRVPPPPPPQTQSQPVSEKNLRFFGDTDLESNPPSFSRAASAPRARPSVMALNRNQKHSQSAYHLDRITKPVMSKSQPRSSSLQNLEDGIDEVDRTRRRHHSRSRELDDISESASDSERPKPHSKHHSSSSTTRLSSSRDNPNFEPIVQRKKYFEEHSHRNGGVHDRRTSTPRRDSSDPARIEFRKPPPGPPGPPKPARTLDRRQTYSRERDRVHDSSGTEGESSLHSQRSVVYLHATTVGAIPQPYHMNSSRRRAMSREELSALKKKERMQPMTRTVSRSVSMLAPWKPKHLHEGYEINYSQEPTEMSKKSATLQKKSSTHNSSGKSKKSISSGGTLQRSKKGSSSRDDLSSNRSLTSASKSGFSMDKKSSSDSRKDTIGRRKVK